jgi:type IV fimbrial biogenesis protein FimT
MALNLGDLMKPALKKVRNRPGFTLYEVVVVMVIIAVISAIAILNYVSWLPGIRLNGAARQVMGDLMTARMNSLKENASVVVSRISNHSYAITVGSKTPIIKDLQQDYPGTHINFTSIVFSSTGTTSPRTIVLENSGGIKRMTIAITGRVKIN